VDPKPVSKIEVPLTWNGTTWNKICRTKFVSAHTNSGSNAALAMARQSKIGSPLSRNTDRFARSGPARAQGEAKQGERGIEAVQVARQLTLRTGRSSTFEPTAPRTLEARLLAPFKLVMSTRIAASLCSGVESRWSLMIPQRTIGAI
jgi:hypothetical protein